MIQFPQSVERQTHPPLISFQMADIRSSLDPLLFKWLEYRVTYYNLGTLCTTRPEVQHYEGASSDTGTKKKTFPSLHESVHSSSDKEKRKSVVATEKSKTLLNDEIQKKHDSKSESEVQVHCLILELD